VYIYIYTYIPCFKIPGKDFYKKKKKTVDTGKTFSHGTFHAFIHGKMKSRYQDLKSLAKISP